MNDLENFRDNWGLEIAKKQSTLDKRCCCFAINKYLDGDINDVNKEAYEGYMFALNRSYDIPKDVFGVIYSFIGKVYFDYVCIHCNNGNLKVLEYKESEIYLLRKYKEDSNKRKAKEIKEGLTLSQERFDKYQKYKHFQKCKYLSNLWH